MVFNRKLLFQPSMYEKIRGLTLRNDSVRGFMLARPQIDYLLVEAMVITGTNKKGCAKHDPDMVKKVNDFLYHRKYAKKDMMAAYTAAIYGKFRLIDFHTHPKGIIDRLGKRRGKFYAEHGFTKAESTRIKAQLKKDKSLIFIGFTPGFVAIESTPDNFGIEFMEEHNFYTPKDIVKSKIEKYSDVYTEDVKRHVQNPAGMSC